MNIVARAQWRAAIAAVLAAFAATPKLGAQPGTIGEARGSGQGALPTSRAPLWHVPPNDESSPGDRAAAGGRASCAASAAAGAGPAAGTLAPAGARLASLVAGAVALPLCGRRTLVLSARGEASALIAPFAFGSWRTEAAFALPAKAGSVWLAYRSSASPVQRTLLESRDSGLVEHAGAVLDRDVLHQLSIGVSRRMGQLLLSLSAGGARAMVHDEVELPPRIVIDTVWNDTSGWVPEPHALQGGRGARALGARWMTGEANASWMGERVALGVTVGGWMPTANGRGLGWGALEVARRIQPGAWLVAGAGVSPYGARGAGATSRYSTVGLRFSHGTRRGQAGSPEPFAEAGVLTIIRGSAGMYSISLRAPEATHVEISGDFTGWKPVALASAPGGWWSATVRLTPGAHRVNVRIDGGRWHAPPGTTPIADDFGGSTGLVVVPEQ